MFETTFYRFEPVIKEEMDDIFENRDAIAFVIKEDTTKEVKKYINWVASLTPYEDHTATYIIITGEILNKYYSEFWDYERPYPNDITFLAFDLNEMEDRNAVLGELGFGDNFWVTDLVCGFCIEETIKEQERINDL